MALTLNYKDRAKQRLEQPDGVDKWLLSSPATGYVSLPDGEFSCTAVCADGKWWSGTGDATGGYLSFVKIVGSPGDLSGEDFSTNPADVFCTITADEINKIGTAINQMPVLRQFSESFGQSVNGGTTFPVAFTSEPDFSSVFAYSCPDCDGEFDIRVVATLDGAIANIYSGSFFVRGEGVSISTVEKIHGTDTNLTVGVTADANTKPVIACSITGGVGDYQFLVTVRVIDLECQPCW